MAAINVVDPKRARNYVRLGIQIGVDIPRNPETLDEAVLAYAKVPTLVGNNEASNPVTEPREASPTALSIWLQKRKEYRVSTKERYRQLLLDIAQEERLNEQVSYTEVNHGSKANIFTASRLACKETSKNGG